MVEQGLTLVVQKVIRAPAPLPSGTAQAAARFWEARRVRFSTITDTQLAGKRGSLWWNAVTFDMSKLRSDLTIDLEGDTGLITCTLRVNRFLQTITDMNRQYWIEEMRAFESSIAGKGDRAAEWQEFKQAYDKDAWRWTLAVAVTVSVAILGRELIGPLFAWLAGLLGR